MKFILNLYHLNKTDDELLQDLKKTAAKLGKRSLGFLEYDAKGQFSASTVSDRFGTWNKALERAGLEVTRRHNISEDDLFENMKHVWMKLKRQPVQPDMVKPVSAHSASTYIKRFGSWREALVAFVKYAGKKHPKCKRQVPDEKQRTGKKINHSIHNHISKAMRFDILNRDKYKCRFCGRSPATDPKVILHVDHIMPLSKGGKSTLKNLQTLCKECNLGKGKKLMSR